MQVLELDLNKLWGHRSPDESFLLIFPRAIYAMLEQPSASRSGSSSLRGITRRVLVLVATKYGQSASITSGLVRLLLECEHLAAPLAELAPRSSIAGNEETAEAESLLEEGAGVRLVTDLLSQLTGLATAEIGVDSAGPKNISAFLQAVAARSPLILWMARFAVL